MVIYMVALYVAVVSTELDISGYIGAGRGSICVTTPLDS
jgi:hypothetical protein